MDLKVENQNGDDLRAAATQRAGVRVRMVSKLCADGAHVFASAGSDILGAWYAAQHEGNRGDGKPAGARDIEECHVS